MAERGRPTTFTQEMADRICERLAKGESLRSICRDDDMPPESTVRTWALDNKDFYAQYARARDMGLDSLADEVQEIADVGSDDVARDRLRFDARRWYLSKLAPKRYGDKIGVEHDVSDPVAKLLQDIASNGSRPGPKS